MDNEVAAGINAKTKIITAKGEGEAREIAAKAEQTWEQLTGEGKAQAAYMMLMKQSEGYKKMATDLDVPANIVIALETAKELMQKGQSNTIIYGDNPIFGQLFATLPALKDLLIEKTKEINKEA